MRPRAAALPRIGVGVLAAIAGLLSPATAREYARIGAETTCGPVIGSFTGSSDTLIAVFKGIPYGADTAKRRFQAPQPPAPWKEPLVCDRFGPVAPQANPHDLMSEDCLRLNVWTPSTTDAKRRPVLVYFHGGAYNGGSVNDDLYDGVNLCRKGDVVVVTVNHRLNGFGFLYLAEIAGPKYAASGNAGMFDLVLALQWVHDNIAHFGGDPGCVTIFGQSGGGAKCATLMAMPAARGLFQRVWTMSGQQLTGRTRAHATADARRVLATLGISPDHIDEIDRVSVEKLQLAMRGGTWAPVMDGEFLPRDPFAPDASPLSKDIPMVLGNAHDETRNLIGRDHPELFALTWPALPAALEAHIRPFIGKLSPAEIVATYRKLYPAFSPADVFFAATTAARSWKGMVLESERRVRQGGPTWVYTVAWPSPVDGGKWRAPHTIDIPLVFDNVANHRLTAADRVDAQPVADVMSAALLAFARTGNPNAAGLPSWPKYELRTRPTMIFDQTSHVEDDPRGAERLLFAPVVYVQPGT